MSILEKLCALNADILRQIQGGYSPESDTLSSLNLLANLLQILIAKEIVNEAKTSVGL